MREIVSKVGRVSTEYFVVDLEDEPVKIDFVQQVEDIIVSSPDGEILIGWDYDKDEDFTDMNSMLLKPYDNMKELTKDRCTHFYMMPKEKGKKIRVYCTVQR